MRSAPALLMLSMLLGAATAPSVLSAAPSVVVNDRLLTTKPAPLVQQGRVLLPIRAIFQALGAHVDYDGAHHAVAAKRGAHEIYLPIGATFAFVDGKRIALDVGSFVRDGHTFVPLRFVAQSLGASVVYVASANVVMIRSNGNAQAVALASPTATPYAENAEPFAPTPEAPPLVSPSAYPDQTRSDVYPFLPSYALSSNGLFFGIVGIPNGYGYFTVPGIPGVFPLLPWPGIPGRYYGTANIPFGIAAPVVNVSGRFYGPNGLWSPFTLAVPMGTGAVTPILIAVPVPAPTPVPTPVPTPTPLRLHTPLPYRTALPPMRRPVGTPTPALHHLLTKPVRTPIPVRTPSVVHRSVPKAKPTPTSTPFVLER